jgi:hypothetical protein
MTPPGLRTDFLFPEEIGSEVCVAVGDALLLVVVALMIAGADVDSTRRFEPGSGKQLARSLIAAL